MSSDRCQVLLVGCVHLATWDGLDGRPDVLAPPLQNEVESLVAGLAKFAPSKVAVEVLPGRQAELDRIRSAYNKAGPLDRSEVTQVGIRLAELTGATLHGVDADWTLDWQGVNDFLDRHPDRKPASAISVDGQRLLDELSTRRPAMTLTEFVREINGDLHAALNDREYLDTWLAIGTDDNQSGVDLVSSWYRRNLRILANIRRLVSGGDRVAVLFGVGHIWSLRHFVDTSSFFERLPLEDVLLQVEAGRSEPHAELLRR